MNLIERKHATICLEEADKTFPKESSRVDIQAAINSGYEPDGGSIAHGNREVPMHAFVAFAGIGPVLETNAGLEPLWHRTVQVEMEPVMGVRFPEYDGEKHARGTAYLRSAITSWTEIASQVYGPGLRRLDPVLLPNVDARRDQIWRVLRRIGMAAGPQWQARIDEACIDVEAGRSGAAPVLTQQQRIMADVYTATYGVDRMSTEELIDRLRRLPESPWAFLWPNGSTPGSARELAALLEPHGLRSVIDRYPLPGGVGMLKAHGYRLTDHQGCERCGDETHTDDFGSDTDEQSADRMTNGGMDDREMAWAMLTGAPIMVNPATPRVDPRVSFSG
jgi:hypothetical protein